MFKKEVDAKESSVEGDTYEHIVVHKSDSTHTISLETLNKVLWQFEHNKDTYYNEQSKYRLGRILTIVDGSIADETQRKAIKDLINDAWYSDHRRNIDSTPFTTMFDVQIALGIDTKNNDTPMLQVEHYNPYKDLVK